MNWGHFKAFIWLRWRLRVNQLKRGGVANVVVLAILAVLGGITAIALFVGFFLFGLFGLPAAPITVVLFVWDGLIAAFLFCWAVGLVAELQRAEVLSLEKFLHLPVSLWGAFLLNYLSSLFSLNLVMFLPAMVGLSLGLIGGFGWGMLPLLPLLVAFVFMVTALTYQFQGWLAALMVNKRRRRTIIVLVTVGFVLIFQVPNMLGVFRSTNKGYFDTHKDLNEHLAQEQAKLLESLKANEITSDEFRLRKAKLESDNQEQQEELDRQTWETAQRIGRLVNMVVPPLWLAYGALAAAEGNILPTLLGILGLGLIGVASFRRAYGTTLRLYTGHYTSGKRKKAVAAQPAKGEKHSAGMLEGRLPWISEQASAVALASFRSLLRAPEAKMMFAMPVILGAVFGATVWTNPTDHPEALRQLMAFGAISTALVTTIQLVGNMFGFDRAGFRVYVLCSAPRRDVLLGKNLAFAPLVIGLAAVMAVLVQLCYPMRLDHFITAVPQTMAMYLVLCIMGNWLSMLAPMPISSGAFKPSNPKLVPIMIQLGFLLLLAIAILPMLLPVGIELLLDYLEVVQGLPICLLLALLECVAVFFIYRVCLTAQGSLLQSREQQILQIVTTKAE